jgi:hypothetical protein
MGPRVGPWSLVWVLAALHDVDMDMRIDARTGLEELDRDECLRLIAHAPLGRLAVVVAGYPLVFPVNFTLDADAIVLRTDRGTKLYGARNGPVAFECDGIDLVYHTGWSVLVSGTAEEIHNPIDVARLERLPLGPWSPKPKPVWLRIRPRSMSGRRIPPHGPA